jgi:glycosyltransferase involved in cell wall biosynthesis
MKIQEPCPKLLLPGFREIMLPSGCGQRPFIRASVRATSSHTNPSMTTPLDHHVSAQTNGIMDAKAMVVLATRNEQARSEPLSGDRSGTDMDAEPVSLSLVVATRGRTHELEQLFDSLAKQEFDAFEIVLVDQNDDERLAEMCNRWSKRLKLTRIFTPTERGASRGRNAGWQKAHGSFVLFPDDDCRYPPWILSSAMKQLRLTGADILTGRAADEAGRDVNGRFERMSQWVTPNSVWTTQIEWVAFYKRSALEAVNGFDVDIGIGAATPWQACEGQDIVLRALMKGLKCYYDPSLYGHHAPMNVATPNEEVCRKGRMYGRGMGYVLRIHGFSIKSAMNWVLRPTMKACLFLARVDHRRFRYYRDVAIGRWEGWTGRVIG